MFLVFNGWYIRLRCNVESGDEVNDKPNQALGTQVPNCLGSYQIRIVVHSIRSLAYQDVSHSDFRFWVSVIGRFRLLTLHSVGRGFEMQLLAPDMWRWDESILPSALPCIAWEERGEYKYKYYMR